MDCQRVSDNLGAYLDGEVSEETRRAVERHVGVCPECSRELAELRQIADELSSPTPVRPPSELWAAIEQGLESESEICTSASASRRSPPLIRFPFLRGRVAAAASIVFAIGAGLAGLMLLQETTPSARAATVDYRVLLDGLRFDPEQAFQDFLAMYDAREIPAHRMHDEAPNLNFEAPRILPNGFEQTAAYVLRFGDSPGLATAYRRTDGEFLAVLIHPAIHREDYGTHKDRPCVIGEHRGHTVEVGNWRLVHLTDPTTCHCVLSRLDLNEEVPAIMAAVAPRSKPIDHGHGSSSDQDHVESLTP